MASTENFILYCMDQLQGIGDLRFRKMFGEYMIYVNEKPIILVCDNIVYIKKEPFLTSKTAEMEVGVPYGGAKEHYVLDIEDSETARYIVRLLEQNYVFKKKPK